MLDTFFIIVFLIFILIEIIVFYRKKAVFKNSSSLSFYLMIATALFFLVNIAIKGEKYGVVATLCLFIVVNVFIFYKEIKGDKK